MKRQRKIYLKAATLKQAKKRINNAFSDTKTRIVEIDANEACGRVLAEPVFARISSPSFHSAAMDGIAVFARSTFGAAPHAPMELVIGKDAFFINTGHMLPPGTDAVIMIEDINIIENKRVRIENPVFPWENVRKIGEDIVATELIFPRNHKITPYSIGAIIASGNTTVRVYAQPSVVIIPTGTEIVSPSILEQRPLAPGEILESNGSMLAAMIRQAGGIPKLSEIIPDEPELIAEAILKAIDSGYDMIILIGGSSAGSADYGASVIGDLGEIIVHGVAMMPGKPVAAGKVSGRPVFCMPGYPVSCAIAFEELCLPLMGMMTNSGIDEPETILAKTAKKIPGKIGMEEFVRVRLGRVGNEVVAVPLSKGAGNITSLTRAEGILAIPPEKEGINQGENVRIRILCPKAFIEKSLLITGSHDNSLDLIADMIKAKDPEVTVASSHVGSMAGLAAIKNGICHMAPTHLIDEKTGEYNISYVRRILPETPVFLYRLAMREQGLIIEKGNPKGIHGIEDLARPDVSFINRQKGSGTRVLLDLELARKGIATRDIKGYEKEEFTHMAVAAAVRGKAADAGLGIYAAAKALDLDFIPVALEAYDIVVLKACYDLPQVRLFFAVITSHDFKKRLQELGGYITDQTGELIWES